MCVRIWKLKERHQNMTEIDDRSSEQDTMTDEELSEKRAQIEERKKDKEMQKQIGKNGKTSKRSCEKKVLMRNLQ